MCLCVPMIYVVISSKYDKCVITVEVYHKSISHPTLSYFRKIFPIKQLSFVKHELNYTLQSIIPLGCDLVTWN